MCVSSHDDSTGKTQTIHVEGEGCTRCFLLERELLFERKGKADLAAENEKLKLEKQFAMAAGRDLQHQLDEMRKRHP